MYITLCLLPLGASWNGTAVVSHLILESRLEIKIEKHR
jgi:hypothetical protein